MRRKDREVSAEQAWEIVERCSYGVLAMTKPDGTPYAVPVNFAREGNCLYIHCAQAGEKTDCLNHQPQVCVTCVEGGAWVDQPALTTRYASAVMLGRVEEVTDEADKVKALRLLCMRLAPEHPRSHGDFSECRGKTAVWRITVEQITGKEFMEILRKVQAEEAQKNSEIQTEENSTKVNLSKENTADTATE